MRNCRGLRLSTVNMNYYYELKEGVTTFGKDIRYLVMPDCSPANGGWLNHFIHDEALKYSSRVWLENANGVTLVKGLPGDNSWGVVDEREFTWIKLKSHIVK